jgi:Tol biopolymer transport system component
VAKDDSYRVAVAVLMAVLLALVTAEPSRAAFPGANGVIAFDANGDIWLTDSRGVDSFHVNLTNSAGATDYNASMSPDGRKVAFQSNRDGVDFEIYTLDIYTGALTQVTDNTVQDGNPAWSPDGTRLAYEEQRTDPGRTDRDIFTRNANGTGTATDVTPASTEDDLAPAWSPDSNEIANYISASGDIVVQNLNTGSVRTIGFDGSGYSRYINPNWSPDGSRVVYQFRDMLGDYEVWTMRSSDGTDRRQLTTNTFDDEYPAYSPDGTRITFSRNPSSHYDLYTMSSSDDGTSADEGLIAGSPDSEFAPDWGPVAPPAAPGCTMSGTFAADHIVGTTGNDTICSLGGNDSAYGDTGDDTLKGGGGRDELSGYLGRDRHFGGAGRDTLDSRDGVNGNDSLNGGPGRDRCQKDRRENSIRSCP